MTVTQFQSWIGVHPDHVGFVIGNKGATVKKIANDTKCWIRIQEPNQFSNFPWFLVKGDLEANVCEAYHRIFTIANEAERRRPRLSVNLGSSPHTPTPPQHRVKLVVNDPKPESSTIVDIPEVIVTKMTDSTGIERLVDTSKNDVYDENGILVGVWTDGVVLSNE